MSNTIAILTDFGTQDVYVGLMKGVMNKIAPDTVFIDLTHELPPQSVRGGALALANSIDYFAPGAVFLVVVDPGVGSKREAIAVKAGDYYFIAPDNGVLSYILPRFENFEAYALENTAYQLPKSHTFHGRDIFAPAAAYLARGDVPLAEFGRKLDRLITLPTPFLQVQDHLITGEVVHVDHFGNVLTSIGPLRWVDDDRLIFDQHDQSEHTVRIGASSRVEIHTEVIYNIVRSYYEADRGQLLNHLDSNGYLEISVNQGNAAQRLGVTIGDHVKLIVVEDE